MRDREQGEDRQVMQVLGLNEEAQKSLTLVTEGLHKKYTCVNGKHPVLKFTINTHTHSSTTTYILMSQLLLLRPDTQGILLGIKEKYTKFLMHLQCKVISVSFKLQKFTHQFH